MQRSTSRSGYGGRREIADAVRSLLLEHAASGGTIEELAEVLDVEHIAEHLYTRASPTRTWSSAPAASSGCRASCSGSPPHSEFYFCELNWPDFRRIDFLRALRSYATGERRYGV